MISEAYYLEADEALDSGDYELASTLFSQVDGYQDATAGAANKIAGYINAATRW